MAVMEDKDQVWRGVLAALRLNVSEGTFNTYLRHTELIETTPSADKLVCQVGCSSAFIKTTLEQRYWGQISGELTRILNRDCEPVFVVIPHKEDRPQPTGPLFSPPAENDSRWKGARLRADFTFDNFAVGGSNQMAYAAATAVARSPGGAYNPLFIHGGVGVGKTHLMQAIGHEVLKKDDTTILFCTGEEFTNDLVEGIQRKTTDKVRAKYRRVKLLLIDDVQFIAGKASVQEEFFHTFNALQREGGQIVMTSDRPPGEISRLEERLRSRFGAGLIVDITPPDLEMRTAILLIKAKQRQVDLSIDLARLIAEHIEGLRELEGFLVRLLSEVEINHQPLDRQTVERLLHLSRPTNGQGRIVTPAEVINAVSTFYGVGVQQLKGERRTKTIVWPRQILMHLLHSELKLPLEEVGRLVGGRDHTTVMHANDKVKKILVTDPTFKDQLTDIKRKLLIPS